MMKMIEIANLTTKEFDEKKFQEIAEKVLGGEGRREASFSLALLGPGRMRKINKRYRGKNRVTDVLSFPALKFDLTKPFSITTREVRKAEGLGEIVICPSVVKKNAERLNLDFEQELGRVLVHGLLHLLGYDHEKGEPEAERMREKERGYLKNFFPASSISL